MPAKSKLPALLDAIDVLAEQYTRKTRKQANDGDGPSMTWTQTLEHIAKLDKLARAVRKEQAE